MTIRTAGLLVALSLLVATPLLAAGRSDKHVTLVIHHYDGQVEYIDLDGPRPKRDPLTAINGYDIPPNATVHFEIADHNPLLFTYSIEGGTDTDNSNYAVAASYVGGLQAVVTFLKPFVPTEQRGEELSPRARILVEAGFNEQRVDDFVKDVAELEARTKEVAILIEQTGKSRAEAELAKTKVASWGVDDLEKRIAGHLAVFTKARDALRKFHPTAVKRSGQQQSSSDPLNTTGTSLGGTTNKPNETGTSGAAVTVSAGSGSQGQGSTGASGGVIEPTEINAGAAALAGGDNSLFEAYDDLRTETDKVAEHMAALKAFAVAIRSVLTKKSDFTAYKVGLQKDKHPILTIGFVKQNEAAAKKSPLPSGKFQFDLVHDSRVKYSVGPALLYSWVEQQDWDTEATSAGKFHIVRKDSGNDVNGVTLAAMLGLTPSRFADGVFAPSLQIGFSPVKDRFGAFLGLSFKAYDLFTIGGGVAYQQTERLDGQAEGQELDAADQLRITTRPQTGVYFSITVPLAGSKK